MVVKELLHKIVMKRPPLLQNSQIVLCWPYRSDSQAYRQLIRDNSHGYGFHNNGGSFSQVLVLGLVFLYVSTFSWQRMPHVYRLAVQVTT